MKRFHFLSKPTVSDCQHLTTKLEVMDTDMSLTISRSGDLVAVLRNDALAVAGCVALFCFCFPLCG